MVVRILQIQSHVDTSILSLKLDLIVSYLLVENLIFISKSYIFRVALNMNQLLAGSLIANYSYH